MLTLLLTHSSGRYGKTIGPEILCADNPRLIFARMTGWGQSETQIMCILPDMMQIIFFGWDSDLFRRGDERPLPPGNFAGDYAGGGTMLAMGVLLALVERQKSGKGQVIDVAMTDGANYVALPLFKWMQPGGIIPQREDGHLKRQSLNSSPGPTLEQHIHL